MDLDGTLLDPTGTLRVEDAAALRAAMAQGLHVTILSGRLFPGVRPTVRALGLSVPLGCADGTQVVMSQDGAPLWSDSIAGETARRIGELVPVRRTAPA